MTVMRWFLMALALLLLSSSPWEAQQAPREVHCPPKEPNSFCVLRGPLGYNMRPWIAFSPDGQWLATSWGPWLGQEGDPMIWVWRIADGKLATRLQLSEGIWEVRFSPDSQLLASPTEEAIRIWEVGTWKEIHTLRLPDVNGPLAFSPTGQWLAVRACRFERDPLCTQPAVILVDPYKGVEVKRIERAHQEIITDLAFLSEEILVTGSVDPFIKFWQVPAGRLTRFIYPVGGVETFEISPNKKFLAVIEYSGRGFIVFDVTSGRQLGSIRENFVWISFSPNGQFLAGSQRYSQQEDRKLLLDIWRFKEAVKDWQVARTLHIPVPNPANHFLGGLSFSPDGKILAIHIWNAAGVEQSIQLWYVGDLR
jgi:WD40 repeat protein